MVSIKTVVSNSPNKEIHERIETNESNKFSSSGENKSEEERASNNDETESGEYVLSRPPKKPGGKEADEVDTTTIISWMTASTSENRNQAITNRLEN